MYNTTYVTKYRYMSDSIKITNNNHIFTANCLKGMINKSDSDNQDHTNTFFSNVKIKYNNVFKKKNKFRLKKGSGSKNNCRKNKSKTKTNHKNKTKKNIIFKTKSVSKDNSTYFSDSSDEKIDDIDKIDSLSYSD